MRLEQERAGHLAGALGGGLFLFFLAYFWSSVLAIWQRPQTAHCCGPPPASMSYPSTRDPSHASGVSEFSWFWSSELVVSARSPGTPVEEFGLQVWFVAWCFCTSGCMQLRGRSLFAALSRQCIHACIYSPLSPSSSPVATLFVHNPQSKRFCSVFHFCYPRFQSLSLPLIPW